MCQDSLIYSFYSNLPKMPHENETSSPKGNNRSPESNVQRSNLISKNIQMGHGNQRPEIKLIRAFMPVLVTSNFDDDLIKNE